MQQSQAITRKSASNLALAFVLLPRSKREGMSALYAFCREIDDVADEADLPVEQRRARLAEWREDVRRACGTETPQMPVNRELQPVIRRPYRRLLELAQRLDEWDGRALRAVRGLVRLARQQTDAAAGDYAEDLAACMLATTLGIEFDESVHWDERKELWKINNQIYKTANITQSAIGDKRGFWTTVVAAAVFVP